MSPKSLTMTHFVVQAAPSYFDNPIIYKFQSVVHVDRVCVFILTILFILLYEMNTRIISTIVGLTM